MDIYVLDKNFDVVRVIDEYISVIWTTRYYTYGDFELYLGANSEILNDLKFGYYLVREQDIVSANEYHNVMIILNREMVTDADAGDTIIFTGQCLKSILRRRVIKQTVFTATNTLRDDLWWLIMNNFTTPTDSDRTLTIKLGTDRITNTYNIDCQMTGKTVSEAFFDLCQSYGYGYDMYIKDGDFYMYLYEGTDRSHDQNVNPYVTFSPEFDNLISCDYKEMREDYANFAYVAGEGEGVARTIATVGTTTGLDRIEIWVDARNASSNNGSISESDYIKQLKQDGRDALAEHKATASFEGELNNAINYELGVDYFLGDIVQIENTYGVSAHARIVEIIENDDETGNKIIPTFSEMEVTS
jgi:hypothetical protein